MNKQEAEHILKLSQNEGAGSRPSPSAIEGAKRFLAAQSGNVGDGGTGPSGNVGDGATGATGTIDNTGATGTINDAGATGATGATGA